MPKGPHDDEIDHGDHKDDHAKERRDEFLKKRLGEQPPVKKKDKDQEGDDADKRS